MTRSVEGSLLGFSKSISRITMWPDFHALQRLMVTTILQPLKMKHCTPSALQQLKQGRQTLQRHSPPIDEHSGESGLQESCADSPLLKMERALRLKVLLPVQ